MVTEAPSSSQRSKRSLACSTSQRAGKPHALIIFVPGYGSTDVPGFAERLLSLDVDVLALFGDKDINVDWRKTKALNERTIGQNPRATLTVETFPDGNHNIQRSATGG